MLSLPLLPVPFSPFSAFLPVLKVVKINLVFCMHSSVSDVLAHAGHSRVWMTRHGWALLYSSAPREY